MNIVLDYSVNFFCLLLVISALVTAKATLKAGLDNMFSLVVFPEKQRQACWENIYKKAPQLLACIVGYFAIYLVIDYGHPTVGSPGFLLAAEYSTILLIACIATIIVWVWYVTLAVPNRMVILVTFCAIGLLGYSWLNAIIAVVFLGLIGRKVKQTTEG